MTVLSVPEMHCEHCVSRIDKALKDAGLEFTVSLKDKTVSVVGDEDEISCAISELDDLGFEAEPVK
ncbi:MAG: heavy-metal-associated domain-containing protein [Oscillospiraceae bacterium]|nr:heavy-metal-associated domain-containing protein [Oscillospiraceae bacterium]